MNWRYHLLSILYRSHTADEILQSARHLSPLIELSFQRPAQQSVAPTVLLAS